MFTKLTFTSRAEEIDHYRLSTFRHCLRYSKQTRVAQNFDDTNGEWTELAYERSTALWISLQSMQLGAETACAGNVHFARALRSTSCVVDPVGI